MPADHSSVGAARRNGRIFVFSLGGPNGGLGGRKLWTVDREGGNPTQLTKGQAHDDFAPAWSPDGTRIAFTRNDRLVTVRPGTGLRDLHVGASFPDWATGRR